MYVTDVANGIPYKVNYEVSKLMLYTSALRSIMYEDSWKCILVPARLFMPDEHVRLHNVAHLSAEVFVHSLCKKFLHPGKAFSAHRVELNCIRINIDRVLVY